MTHGGHNDDQESVENTRQHQQSAGMSYMFTLSPGTFQPLITWSPGILQPLITWSLTISPSRCWMRDRVKIPGELTCRCYKGPESHYYPGLRGPGNISPIIQHLNTLSINGGNLGNFKFHVMWETIFWIRVMMILFNRQRPFKFLLTSTIFSIFHIIKDVFSVNV